MPPRTGSVKAEDGRFYTPEQMKQLGLKPVKKKPTKKPVNKNTTKRTLTKKQKSSRANPNDKAKSVQVISGEPNRKIKIKKGTICSDKNKLPRITLTYFDEKGRMISTTFVCNAKTLRFFRNEDYVFTESGRKQSKVCISIEADVIEIE